MRSRELFIVGRIITQEGYEKFQFQPTTTNPSMTKNSLNLEFRACVELNGIRGGQNLSFIPFEDRYVKYRV